MRETQVLIDSSRLQHNVEVIRKQIANGTHILANLKANAYGLGAVAIGKYLESLGASYFSVAYLNEGIYLRQNGITTSLLVFNPSFDDFQPLVDYHLEPEVSSIGYLVSLLSFLKSHNIEHFPIHIKLDTGMHRAGIMPDELPELIDLIRDNKHIKVVSVFSHLAAAEEPAEDVFTRSQISLFDEMSGILKSAVSDRFFRHLLNTAGIFRFPEAQYDMVRPGLGIFGFHSLSDIKPDLLPIAKLVTKINQIKVLSKGEKVGYNRRFIASRNNVRVALLPLGYADGISRILGNKNYTVKIKGQDAPIIGTISMDTLSVDVSEIDCKQGDEVIVIDNQTDVYDLSVKLHTISYEIITNLAQRIPRRMI